MAIDKEKILQKYKKDYDTVSKGTSDELKNIDCELIVPNENQPRKAFDEETLKELANSIKENGLLQPIVVVEKKDSGKTFYMLISGERRLRATKILGNKFIKAIVVNHQDIDTHTLSIVENIQRKDLTKIEEAIAYESLSQTKGITLKEVAKLVGKSYTTIIRITSLLKLPNEILEQPDLIEKIPLHTIQEISSLKGDDEKREAVYNFLEKKKTKQKKENDNKKTTKNKNDHVKDLIKLYSYFNSNKNDKVICNEEDNYIVIKIKK